MSDPADNPVFNYRADFRAFANSLQKWLMLIGLLLLAGGAFALLFAKPSGGPYCLPCILKTLMILGGFLLLSGIGWGFYWRKKIRDEFRTKFGPGA